MKLGPAQISTTCTSFIYLLLLHFPLLFLLLNNDTVVQINDLQSHFYLSPHFTNMQVEKKNPKFYPNKRTDYYLINYCCTNTIPKDFSPSFHIFYFGSFFSHLRTRDLLTVIFQKKNDAAYLATNAFEMLALEKVKQLWILYMKVKLSFYYLSMHIPKTLLFRNFLYLLYVVCSYFSWMKYVRRSV